MFKTISRVAVLAGLFCITLVIPSCDKGAKIIDLSQEALGECNKGNYRDFIIKAGVHNCELSGGIFKDLNLTGLNFERANLKGANFTGAVLVEANLKNVDAKGAIFERARLNKADLTGGDFTDASFLRAALSDAIYDRATFKGANIAGVTQIIPQTGKSFSEYAKDQGAVVSFKDSGTSRR